MTMSANKQRQDRSGFLARWLLATWLPPIALVLLIVALDNVAPTLGAWRARPLVEWPPSVLPFLLWLLVATGQAWAIGTHHEHRRQWAAVTFLAGVLAMLCLYLGSGMYAQRGALFRVLSFLAVWFLGIARPTPLMVGASAAVFGIVIGAAQAALLRWRWRARLSWILFSAAAGVGSFGLLAPLYWRLYVESVSPVAGHPRFVVVPLLLIGPSMALFMLGWLVFALLTGLGLNFALTRQLRRDQVRVAASFD